MRSAPLRFLLATLLLWVGVRAAILVPGAGSDVLPPAAAPPPPSRLALAAPTDRWRRAVEPAWRHPATAAPRPAAAPVRPAGFAANARPVPVMPTPALTAAPAGSRPALAPSRTPAPSPYAPLPPQPRGAESPSRWSLSAWLLIRREEEGAALAPGGTLGGSQAGARLAYSLGGGVSLSGRAYLPLRRPDGAELAAGLDWRPAASVPVNLLAERRQRLGRQGRNAFALTAYGGVSRNLTPRLRLDVYGQAGIVGLRSRDPFADGAVRLTRRVGPVELGAGVWGAAQPGAARLDAGPGLAWRLPVRDASLQLRAEWRFRLAGDAAPRSGPALTLAADF